MVEVGLDRSPSARGGCRPARSGSPKRRRCARRRAHFMEHVRLDLKASYGLDALYRGGLRVRTTLDHGVAAGRRARDPRPICPPRSDPEAALVAIDPRTGRDPRDGRGAELRAERVQPGHPGTAPGGSAFKPFVLLAALERGISPLEVRNGPSSMTIPDPFCETDGKPWTVSNAGDQSAGTMSLENAMAGSVNTIYRAADGGGRAGGRRGGRAPDGDPLPARRPCARSASVPRR